MKRSVTNGKITECVDTVDAERNSCLASVSAGCHSSSDRYVLVLVLRRLKTAPALSCSW